MKLTKKQKNCPYCHKPYKPFISAGREVSFSEDLYLVGVSNVLGEGPIRETTLGIINVLKVPYCPFCGRPLNEEDSNGKSIDAGFTSGD